MKLFINKWVLQITYQEVVQFFENQGYSLMTKDIKEQGTSVNSLSEYHVSYQQLLNLLAKRVTLEVRLRHFFF